MYINGIVIGVFCTLFVEMAVVMLGLVISKTKKGNYKSANAATKKTGSVGGKYDAK